MSKNIVKDMQDRGEGNEKKSKAMWDDASVEIFISVCVAETLAGNQTGGHLNRIGWKNVIKKFNDLTQRSYVHKQLKNKWTTLKKEWQLWASLVGKETGLGWDPVKQTIIASDEWWEKKVKENSEVAKYRNSGLKNVDQLDILFKEGAVTGVGAWAPSQGLMSNNVQKAPPCEQNDGQDDLENDIDNNEGLDDIADAKTPSPAQPSTEGKGTKRTRDSKRVGIGAKMIKQLDGILEAVNRSKSTDKPGCSIEEVMQMLEGMHEVVNDDELFMKAADIFTERKNREMFVALKQSNRQIMWLKNMSSSSSDSSNTNNSTDGSDDEFYQLVSASCVTAVSEWLKYVDKEPCRTSSYTGYRWVMEVLNGHPIRCHEQFRMEHVFKDLLETLKRDYGLKRIGDITLEEALAMFLNTLGHGHTNRMVQERFQRSGETVSRWFGILLDVVSRMATDIICPHDRQFKRVSNKIKDDNRYWPYFKGCIGAIDGTHVPVVVPREMQVPYIGRKGNTTQNVMAVCDFNMCFTFVWAGWEGAAHDSRIFMEALRRPELKFPYPPSGKYYLVDAGYPHMNGYIGPYRGERYHLPEFRRGSHPRGKKEIFNQRHSSLRCTIERTFGVWKNRWTMIRLMRNFPFEKQVQIVVASMALHNFIRKHSMTDQEFQPYDDDDELLPPGHEEDHRDEEIVDENFTHRREMDVERERIANLLISS